MNSRFRIFFRTLLLFAYVYFIYKFNYAFISFLMLYLLYISFLMLYLLYSKVYETNCHMLKKKEKMAMLEISYVKLSILIRIILYKVLTYLKIAPELHYYYYYYCYFYIQKICLKSFSYFKIILKHSLLILTIDWFMEFLFS